MNAAIFARTGIRAGARATPMRSGAYHWTNENGKVQERCFCLHSQIILSSDGMTGINFSET